MKTFPNMDPEKGEFGMASSISGEDILWPRISWYPLKANWYGFTNQKWLGLPSSTLLMPCSFRKCDLWPNQPEIIWDLWRSEDPGPRTITSRAPGTMSAASPVHPIHVQVTPPRLPQRTQLGTWRTWSWGSATRDSGDQTNNREDTISMYIHMILYLYIHIVIPTWLSSLMSSLSLSLYTTVFLLSWAFFVIIITILIIFLSLHAYVHIYIYTHVSVCVYIYIIRMFVDVCICKKMS